MLINRHGTGIKIFSHQISLIAMPNSCTIRLPNHPVAGNVLISSMISSFGGISAIE